MAVFFWIFETVAAAIIFVCVAIIMYGFVDALAPLDIEVPYIQNVRWIAVEQPDEHIVIGVARD